MVETTTKKIESVNLDSKIVLDIKEDDKKALEHVKERFDAMNEARQPHEALWDFIDAELKAKPRAKW